MMRSGSLASEIIELLVIQPTGFCNIDCAYCYLPGREDRRRMGADVLEAAFQIVFQSEHVAGQVTVLWHAGEPLTLPPDWYRAALAVAEKWRPPDLQVDYHFQSNGILLDDRWINFLSLPSIRIELSIDGPAWLHDSHRRTRRGDGTHHRAMQGLNRLRAAGLPFHVI